MGDQRWRVYSPDLLAAQRKLQLLREQRNRNKPLDQGLLLIQEPFYHGRSLPYPSIGKSPSNSPEQLLGEKSTSAAATNNAKQAHLKEEDKRQSVKDPSVIGSADKRVALLDPCRPIDPTSKTAKLYPDIALGMLRNEQVAAGRIWLLLRHLDTRGSGWIEIKTAREQLNGNVTSSRVCGRRQFRKLLASGEGIFWNRSDQRIWLRSPVKVAAALGVYRIAPLCIARRQGVQLTGQKR